jgi:hypothetical protein
MKKLAVAISILVISTLPAAAQSWTGGYGGIQGGPIPASRCR